MLLDKSTFSVSVWNSYATLREHTFGASMEEEEDRDKGIDVTPGLAQVTVVGVESMKYYTG